MDLEVASHLHRAGDSWLTKIRSKNHKLEQSEINRWDKMLYNHPECSRTTNAWEEHWDSRRGSDCHPERMLFQQMALCSILSVAAHLGTGFCAGDFPWWDKARVWNNLWGFLASINTGRGCHTTTLCLHRALDGKPGRGRSREHAESIPMGITATAMIMSRFQKVLWLWLRKWCPGAWDAGEAACGSTPVLTGLALRGNDRVVPGCFPPSLLSVLQATQ